MHKKHGFTLIELLTVVVIVGILTSVAVPQYRKAIRRSEASTALVNLKILFDAVKQRYAHNGKWPADFKNLEVAFAESAAVGTNIKIEEVTYSLQGGGSDACSTDGTCAVSACRRSKFGRGYCLKAYYKKDDQRDVFTCKSTDTGYQTVCDAFCKDSSTEECTI